MLKTYCSHIVILIAAAFVLQAQNAPAPSVNNQAKADPVEARSTYVLGPDDTIVIRALEAEEINEKQLRVDMSGNIRLPMIGRIHAAGLTVEQLENEITQRLSAYIKQPQVGVNILELRSQPVSIIGSVTNPGVHQLQGRKTLVEMISMAGGLKEDAGPVIRITRQKKWGSVPLTNAKEDPSGQVSTAEVNVKDVMESRDPLANIQISPEDVISVPRAQVVYLMGEVQKPGVYVLRERQSLSVMQALAMSGGLQKTAGPKNAKILRLVAGNADRTEIPIDLKKVMAGHGGDTALLPEDILFIPNNLSKNIAIRTLEAAITIGTGAAIYRSAY